MADTPIDSCRFSLEIFLLKQKRTELPISLHFTNHGSAATFIWFYFKHNTEMACFNNNWKTKSQLESCETCRGAEASTFPELILRFLKLQLLVNCNVTAWTLQRKQRCWNRCVAEGKYYENWMLNISSNQWLFWMFSFTNIDKVALNGMH